MHKTLKWVNCLTIFVHNEKTSHLLPVLLHHIPVNRIDLALIHSLVYFRPWFSLFWHDYWFRWSRRRHNTQNCICVRLASSLSLLIRLLLRFFLGHFLYNSSLCPNLTGSLFTLRHGQIGLVDLLGPITLSLGYGQYKLRLLFFLDF